MKIDVNEQCQLVLKEVYNTILLKTEEGNTFAICMRDDTVEMTVAGSDKHYRANMDTGNIEEM
jgi:hypothetical protein